MNIWSGFWPDFWANAGATLGGVLAGVPIALWVDRRLLRWRRREERQAKAHRLYGALQILSATLQWNRDRSTKLSNAVERGEAPLQVEFNTAVWETVRDAVGFSGNFELQINLANYFEDVQELARLQRHLIDVTSDLPSSHQSSTATREELATLILGESAQLISQTRRLLDALSEAKKAVAPDTSKQNR